MTLLHAPGKVNYTQAKAYSPVRLLSFTQKMMQKLVATNIRDETLGNVHYSVTICLQTWEVHRNCNASCDYTHTESSGKQEVTLEFPRY